MLDKSYQPKKVEKRVYEGWEKSEAFSLTNKPKADPYCIMMPPPNVTGSLHMGHALTFTIQDILVRYYRMQGRNVLWQPGTDHAGIATQIVVEKELEKKGINKIDLGREEFLKKVWEWKEDSGGKILNQLRRLGASPDWSRTRFTMDEGLSLAVNKVFADLYKKKLIYRDKRLVNWDPKLQTAISDLEVEQKEQKGKMWHFKYPVLNQKDTFIVVATTRPETMLGDTAVAVHPKDKRYTSLIGKFCILPIVERNIPIIADEYADPEKGSGAVKITPGHDFNDFDVGRRHDLEIINIFDRFAKLNKNVPEKFVGLGRFKAREKILETIEEMGLLDKEEENLMFVPHGDRSGVIVEPWMTDQWFVNAEKLSKSAISAVKRGDLKFVPKNWEKTFFEWMDNIQPWCISRQIWWGHQIPAWYGPDGKIFVAVDEKTALEEANHFYKKKTPLTRDADVLDTWFSSSLWPFSTLGWPDKTAELKKYYPTNVLVTGFDIIFFWVARMLMMGLHVMKKPPFQEVFVHALVRDEKGQKMSKSKGNVIDPLKLIEEYGTDALRFTLTALLAPGRDVKLSVSRIAGYRNFVTKLWNASRFCQMNNCEYDGAFDPRECKEKINKWIVNEVASTERKISSYIESYKFHEAANNIYRFVWGTFCDWYLEFTKKLLVEKNDKAQKETQLTISWVLNKIMLLLHPFMPYVTEEISYQMKFNKASHLILSEWPKFDKSYFFSDEEAEINWLVKCISAIRSARSEMQIANDIQFPIEICGADQKSKDIIFTHLDIIKNLARIESIAFSKNIPEGALQVVFGKLTLALKISSTIDVSKEKQRLNEEIKKINSEIEIFDSKLRNKDFLDKAPMEIVNEQKEKKDRALATKKKLVDALDRIKLPK
tara:strand:- start:265 stop:2916 length:2652 start_codon:yes stop_codon:yes gene_type:complete